MYSHYLHLGLAVHIRHATPKFERRAEDPAAETDKPLAMELMVADIFNVIKPAEVARRQALRITDESFHQGDAKHSTGMEVSPACDSFATSRVALQAGFKHYLAGWTSFHTISRRLPHGLSGPVRGARRQPRVLLALHRYRCRVARLALLRLGNLSDSHGFGKKGGSGLICRPSRGVLRRVVRLSLLGDAGRGRVRRGEGGVGEQAVDKSSVGSRRESWSKSTLGPCAGVN